MAEYLDPRDGYKLVTFSDWQAPQPWWIEVPEGAELYFSFTDQKTFVKFCEDGWAIIRLGGKWEPSYFWKKDALINKRQHRIIWQRANQPEELPFIDDEPPAHFVVRPKPRERVYAVLGDDNCIRVPKLTADYLFNTVQALGFVSNEQKGAVLYHLNYLKVN